MIKRIITLCIFLLKWVYINQNFIKLDGWIFWWKINNFFEKYNEIQEKANHIIKKELYSEPAHNKKNLRAEKNQHKWRFLM